MKYTSLVLGLLFGSLILVTYDLYNLNKNISKRLDKIERDTKMKVVAAGDGWTVHYDEKLSEVEKCEALSNALGAIYGDSIISHGVIER